MKIKRSICVLVILCVTLCVGGCSGGAGLGSAEKALSQCFSTDSDAIWYQVDQGNESKPGKDSRITTAFVFKKGNLKVYKQCLVGNKLTLGDVAQMSDDEIISKLDEYNGKLIDGYEAYLAEVKTGCDYLLSLGSFDKGYAVQKAAFEQLSKNLTNFNFVEDPQRFKLAVYTDASGNTTEKEGITYSYLTSYNTNLYHQLSLYAVPANQKNVTDTDIKELATLLKNDNAYNTGAVVMKVQPGSDGDPTTLENPLSITTLELTGSFDTAPNAILVYDTNYDGYICQGGVFIKRSNGNKFKLDKTGTDGVLVDPSLEDDILGFN